MKESSSQTQNFALGNLKQKEIFVAKPGNLIEFLLRIRYHRGEWPRIFTFDLFGRPKTTMGLPMKHNNFKDVTFGNLGINPFRNTCSPESRFAEKEPTPEFTCAKSVWAAGREQEMNVSLFFADVDIVSGWCHPPCAESAVMRIWVNNEFAGYGPARGHGWFRVDEWVSFVGTRRDAIPSNQSV